MRFTWTSRARAVTAGLIGLLFVPFVNADVQGQQVDPTRVAAGAAVYGSMCGRCHNARSPLERTDREWVVIIAHMRVRGNLTGPQVRDVLAFLQATNGQPAGSASMDGEEVGPPAAALDPRHLETRGVKVPSGLSPVEIEWVLGYLASIN